MKPIYSFIVSAKLPDNLIKVKELAYNYWWSWDSECRELFRKMDWKLWESTHHNPVELINRLSQDRVSELSEQTDFISYLELVYDRFTKYMNSKAWFQTNFNDSHSGIVAYFSMEYGIHESFPNYSGGLGILSGDHLKSASDLGIPLVGVGLLYQQGYFRQHLTPNGWQNELYIYNDFYSMPLQLVKEENGKPIIIEVNINGQPIYINIWKLQCGRVNLYLLDSNIEENIIPEIRDITDSLYGGTRETRIQQEIILGIGGMRMLERLNIHPSVIHINEGHAAFSLLERTRQYMNKYNTDFYTAKEITVNSSVFTTHTPVPAGNEAFKLDLMEKYFKDYPKNLGISYEEFLRLGIEGEIDSTENFSMTILGIKMTGFRNGVSKLHGEVSRNMWRNLWKDFPISEVPITSITNGVHTLTWISREMSVIFDRYISSQWRTKNDDESIWKKVKTIPSEEIWKEKQKKRLKLVQFVRKHLKTKQKAFVAADQVSQIDNYLSPDALTIGFARRFATYKRAGLLFHDMERLKEILTNTNFPVQIVLAGKAHPHDTQGKEVIQSIIQKVKQYKLEKYVVFLEDYDTVIARIMVKGCDVWLNNPIRPLEASGTSGMKAGLNGTLNLSILDGWWDESYNTKNGFAIGDGEEYLLDDGIAIESKILYDLIEKSLVKLFYDRPENRVPDAWVKMMKQSISTIAGQFSSYRMVKEYTSMMYLPAFERYFSYSDNEIKKSKDIKNWKDKIYQNWDSISIFGIEMTSNGEIYYDDKVFIKCKIHANNINNSDLQVIVHHGQVNHLGEIINPNNDEMNFIGSENNNMVFELNYTCKNTGKHGVTIRVLPKNDLLENNIDMRLCKWGV